MAPKHRLAIKRWTLVSESKLVQKVECEDCGEQVEIAVGASLLALMIHEQKCPRTRVRKPGAKVVDPKGKDDAGQSDVRQRGA